MTLNLKFEFEHLYPLHSGIAQGRPLSPLYNLLIDTLASDVRQLAPGVHYRFSNQKCADDLVVVADCEHDLQVSCDVVAAWDRKWRFKFGVGRPSVQ